MRTRSKQYRAWTSAHNCVACTCTVTALQPFRVWGLFTSWRCALQACPMCCTNALMLLNLDCSCLSLTCIAHFLAVLLEPHVLVLYSHSHSSCQLGSPWVPKKGLLLPARVQTCCKRAQKHHALLASHVMNYLEVWRAVREPTVLPVCVKSRHGILCKTVCRYFGWLTTRSAT